MKDFYTIEDIAKMTGLTTRTIQNYLKEGRLEGMKIGGRWRFTQQDVENLFNNSFVAKDINFNKKQNVLNFVNNKTKNEKQTSMGATVVDYYIPKNETKPLLYELLQFINNNEYDQSVLCDFHFDYITDEQKARFTIMGSIEFITGILKRIDSYTGE